MNAYDFSPQELITAVEQADVKKTDWVWSALLTHPDLPEYWRGYFECFVGELGESLSSESQNYKDELLSRMRSCWL